MAMVRDIEPQREQDPRCLDAAETPGTHGIASIGGSPAVDGMSSLIGVALAAAAGILAALAVKGTVDAARDVYGRRWKGEAVKLLVTLPVRALRRLLQWAWDTPGVHRHGPGRPRGHREGGKAETPFETIETRFLSVTLYKVSGDFTGTVREGRFAGFTFMMLNREDFLTLIDDYGREDEDSAELLEGLMAHKFGEDWRERIEGAGGEERGPAAGEGSMTYAQALKVLGLDEGFTKDAFDERRRALIKRLHGDRGGSDHLAAQVNVAADTIKAHKGWT
jgi:predicted outer membrane lipoprotein